MYYNSQKFGKKLFFVDNYANINLVQRGKTQTQNTFQNTNI